MTLFKKCKQTADFFDMGHMPEEEAASSNLFLRFNAIFQEIAAI